MKGVKTIKGNLKPKVGETNFYEVGEFHNGTVLIDPNTIKWKLYQWKDLEWVELKGPVKTGKKVTFTFPQKWYSRKLLIEAYIYEAEGKALPGLVVKPIMGENKIASIAILNNKGEKQTQETQYGQSIIAKIGTENMLGETLRLSLWERNTVTEEGHNPFGNLKLWDGTAKIIDNNGFVEKKITLSPSFPHLAKKTLFDGSKHEYYLLVEADNKTALEVKPKVSSEIILSPGVSKPKPTPREIAIA